MMALSVVAPLLTAKAQLLDSKPLEPNATSD